MFLFISILAMQAINAQEIETVTRKRIFKVNIHELNGSSHHGFLGYLSDSGLFVSKKPVMLQNEHNQFNTMNKFDYSILKEMRITRKSSVGRGILYGSMIGLFTGFAAGLISGNSPDKTVTEYDWFSGHPYPYTIPGTTAVEKGVVYGVVGGLGGALIGGIVGALAHKTFIIGGKKKNYDEMKETVLERIYTSQPITK